MGWLRDQAGRLIRTKWGQNADMLAEELFAMMTGDEPIVLDSPVTIVNNTDGPALTLRDFGGGNDGIFQIQHAVPPAPLIPNLPPLDFPPWDGDGVGQITITNIYNDGSGEYWTGDRGDPPDTTPGTGTPTGGAGPGGPSTFPGKVTAGGPGDTYTVDVYEGGLSSAPTSRTVKQLSIDSAETIPADTWAMVSKNGSEYTMQVPVWLEDLS